MAPTHLPETQAVRGGLFLLRTTVENSRSCTLQMHGRLLHGDEVAAFQYACDQFIHLHPGGDVILDCASLEYADARGLGALEDFCRIASRAGARVIPRSLQDMACGNILIRFAVAMIFARIQ
jgi:anti-anti-sigma regulatory factor